MATRHEYGNACRRCNAVVRPVLDIGEQYDLALDRRQARERGEQAGSEIGALEVTPRRVTVRRR